uniref:Odorant binding protein n=1 Tax=Lissorhoptrus oryzophilus TaxID=308863 RepID=A0A0B4KZC4_9CUCU|nr:odorant binding protein [Lissorhoptrus oryzophilus]
MKSFLAAVVIIGALACIEAQLTDEQKAKLKEHYTVCVGGTGVDKDVVTKARQGNFVDDPKLKAFAFCMSKRIGFQNEAGDVQPDVVKAKLSGAINDPAAADKLIQQCLIKKENPEDTAFNAFQCYYENTPTHIAIF